MVASALAGDGSMRPPSAPEHMPWIEACDGVRTEVIGLECQRNVSIRPGCSRDWNWWRCSMTISALTPCLPLIGMSLLRDFEDRMKSRGFAAPVQADTAKQARVIEVADITIEERMRRLQPYGECRSPEFRTCEIKYNARASRVHGCG